MEASPQSVASTTPPGPVTSRAPPPQSQEWLKTLIEGARESWTYAIFWQSYDYSGDSRLRWGHGYYKGEEDKEKGKAPKTASSSAEQEHRKKVLRELHALISADDVGDEEVTDTVWFFMLSMIQSFADASSLPGQAFFDSRPIWVTGHDLLSKLACERARQGQVFGLQTMVCIPSANGVVELASTEVILSNLDLMNKVLDLFNPDADSRPSRIKDVADFVYFIGLQPLRKNKRSCEREDTEMQNQGNDNLSKQSRNKEKISDSKCSWPLLSKSSDEANGNTFSCSDNYSGPS